MQLKQTTGYVIRMLMYMARNEGAVCPSAELSASLKIPQKYIVKISAQLRKAGLVSTHTGSQGGYSLAKPAASIRLYDVVLLTEGTVRIHEFPYSEPALYDCFESVQRCWESCLKGVTVADLAGEVKYNDPAPRYNMLSLD